MTWGRDQMAGGRFVGTGVAAGFADGAGACDAGAPEASADGAWLPGTSAALDGDGEETAGALHAARSKVMLSMASDRGIRSMIIPLGPVRLAAVRQ